MLEARLTGVAVKGKGEADEEDGLDDLFGDVGSEDGSSGSSDDNDDDDIDTDAVTRKPARGGAAAAASGGDMGDGVTMHEGRLVVQVREYIVRARRVSNSFAGAGWDRWSQPQERRSRRAPHPERSCSGAECKGLGE